MSQSVAVRTGLILFLPGSPEPPVPVHSGRTVTFRLERTSAPGSLGISTSGRMPSVACQDPVLTLG